jgi:hypothetical protein
MLPPVSNVFRRIEVYSHCITADKLVKQAYPAVKGAILR